jgi:signal recognition particle subunit SEC65
MSESLGEFFDSLNSNDKEIYSEVADFVSKLGYKAKRAKTKDINYVFTNTKTKKHLLKFSFNEGKPILKMKYYASINYSNLFNEGIRNVIEEYNFRYTGCYKCGKCKGAPEGYIYEYPDGKRYFRCGSELICLPTIKKENIAEILQLLKAQHEYYLLAGK